MKDSPLQQVFQGLLHLAMGSTWCLQWTCYYHSSADLLAGDVLGFCYLPSEMFSFRAEVTCYTSLCSVEGY